MRFLHGLLPVLLVAASWSASATTVTRQGAGFQVRYETSPKLEDFFSTASGSSRSVGWETSVTLPLVDDTRVSGQSSYSLHTYAIPSITVKADTGYRLSGVEMQFRGVVLDHGVQDLHWDALLYGYRFTVDGVSRTLVSSLSPQPTPLSGSDVLVRWTLTERCPGPASFDSFSFRADVALVLYTDSPLHNVYGIGFLNGDESPAVEVNFRVDPVDLLTGVPTGGTAPVPEPATWATLLAGLAALGGARRRRRNAA